MGYTHYWYRPQEIEIQAMHDILTDFDKVLPSIKKAMAHCNEEDGGGTLAGGDGKGRPVMTHDEVCFNGRAGNAHETFSFPRVMQLRRSDSMSQDEGRHFEFCKTAQKPYDIAVTAFLIIAKKHLGKKIKVSSDGNTVDWLEARSICQTALGYGGKFFFLNEEDDSELVQVR